MSEEGGFLLVRFRTADALERTSLRGLLANQAATAISRIGQTIGAVNEISSTISTAVEL